MAYDNIPLIVVLWELKDFKGRRKVIVEDCEGLIWDTDINHGTSIRPRSLGIHPGPSYEPAGNNAVSFYAGMFHRGAQLVLTPGAYPDLDHPYNFGGMIHSIKFHQGIAPAPRVSRIPLVVELHEHNYVSSGKTGRVILENVPDLAAYENHSWTRRVRVYKGPDYSPGDKAVLYETKNYGGREEPLGPGDHQNRPNWSGSRTPYNVGSIKVR